jgi:hypothetical protein
MMSRLDRRADFWLQAVDVIKGEMKLIRKRVTNVSKTSTQAGGGKARTG